MKKILIMAGGTGGHVFPALAVAKVLQDEHHVEVRWLGTEKGLEARVVRESDIFLYTISVAGLRGKGFLRLVLAPFQLLRALFQALKIIYRYNPDVVLGMGGFASGPGGVAAWLLRKRLVIHEQNAIMGMTNKILSKFADKVLTGFPFSVPITANRPQKTGSWILNPESYVLVGNPVRDEIVQVGIKKHHPQSSILDPQSSVNILVFGGSLGAHCFNEVLTEVFSQLFTDFPDSHFRGNDNHESHIKQTSRSDTGGTESRILDPESYLNIWHQTGKRDFEEVKNLYKNSKIEVKIDAFIDDMAAAYEWADLVICRAGALTIAELAAVGVASIVVPYPYAVDDHQTANARLLVNHEAAILIPQNQFNSSKLIEIFSNLLSNPEEVQTMGEKAFGCRTVDATQKIVDHLLGKI